MQWTLSLDSRGAVPLWLFTTQFTVNHSQFPVELQSITVNSSTPSVAIESLANRMGSQTAPHRLVAHHGVASLVEKVGEGEGLLGDAAPARSSGSRPDMLMTNRPKPNLHELYPFSNKKHLKMFEITTEIYFFQQKSKVVSVRFSFEGTQGCECHIMWVAMAAWPSCVILA